MTDDVQGRMRLVSIFIDPLSDTAQCVSIFFYDGGSFEASYRVKLGDQLSRFIKLALSKPALTMFSPEGVPVMEDRLGKYEANFHTNEWRAHLVPGANGKGAAK